MQMREKEPPQREERGDELKTSATPRDEWNIWWNERKKNKTEWMRFLLIELSLCASQVVSVFVASSSVSFMERGCNGKRDSKIEPEKGGREKGALTKYVDNVEFNLI